MFALDAAEDHRGEAAVAERQRIGPFLGGLVIPEGEGGGGESGGGEGEARQGEQEKVRFHSVQREGVSAGEVGGAHSAMAYRVDLRLGRSGLSRRKPSSGGRRR